MARGARRLHKGASALLRVTNGIVDEYADRPLEKRHELTDDEMLHYIELTDTLTRQALLQKAPDRIAQQQAVGIAKERATKLFGWDVSCLSTCATPEDGTVFESDGPEALWRVRFDPEDMLVREEDSREGCEVQINAVDGALDYAPQRGFNTI